MRTNLHFIIYCAMAFLAISFQNCAKQSFQLSLSSSDGHHVAAEPINLGQYVHLAHWDLNTRNITQGTEPEATQPFAFDQRPEAPRFLQNVHEVDITRTADGGILKTKPQLYRSIRPTIPPVRTSHDGRLGFNWADLKLYLLAPEKITKPFPFSEAGTQIVTNVDGYNSKIWDLLSLPSDIGKEGGFAGVTICNPVAKQNQPTKCNGKNDCYELAYVGFRSFRSAGNPSPFVDQGEFRSRRVVVEVSNPKTPQAAVVRVEAAPGSAVRIKQQRIQIDYNLPHNNFGVPEPVMTSDGRLFVARMMYNPIRDIDGNGNSGKKDLDIFYMVAPPSSEPCDAANFSYVKRIQYAPDDPAMKDPATGKARYGIAEYPMRDSFGDLIAKDALFPIYPWIDREGNNLFFSTGGSTLHKFNTKDMSYYREVSPGTKQWLMIPNSQRYPTRCLREFGNQCEIGPYNPESNDNVRGFAVLGSWTHGKTVVLDGLINNSDYGLKRGIKFQREINLYQGAGNFDGWVRVGPGRDTGDSANGLDFLTDDYIENSEIKTMGRLTGVIDSTENLLNAYRNMKPTLPRDIVWVMNNNIGSEEVAFDDYLDSRALIVSSMIAGAEFVRNPDQLTFNGETHDIRADGWSYRDGFGWAGHDVPDKNNRPVLIQNAATGFNLPIPKWGYLNRGRVEPVALGGIHGRGLWMDGSNSLTYTFPYALEGTELTLSFFVDNRSLDEKRRQILSFPDGTRILATPSSLRIVKGAEIHELGFGASKNNWTHIGVTIASNHKAFSVFLNGMKKISKNTSTQFFRLSNGAGQKIVLRVGANDGSGFRGWFDELKLFTYIPNYEMMCNHAYGSLHSLNPSATSYWQSIASRYDDSTHREIFAQLPSNFANEKGIASNARFVCTTDYGDAMGIYRSRLREGEGLVSVRDALLFAIPRNGSMEDGRLNWNTNRVDFRGNLFCLSCHSAQERRGMTLAALAPGSMCTMNDTRRQPLQAPPYLTGQRTSSQMASLDSNTMSINNVTDPSSSSLLVDPILLFTNPNGSTCGSPPVTPPLPTPEPPPSSETIPTVTLTLPTNGSTVPKSQPDIQWNSSGIIDFYYVDISTNTQFNGFWNHRVDLPNTQIKFNGASGGWGAVGGFPTAPTNLTEGQTYFVRVAAFYKSGTKIAYSGTASFKIQANSNLDHSNNGWIDSAQKQTDGSYVVYGWACAKNHPNSIAVDLYLGGPYGLGKGLGRFQADVGSEPAVANLCQSTGTHYRFAIPISAALVNTFAGLSIWIHGINPFDATGAMNTILPNSGKISLPANNLDHSNNGWIDSMIIQSDGSYRIYGWACAKNFTDSIPIDVYFGGPYGTGKALGRFMADQDSEPAVANLCRSTGTKYRFAIPVPATIAQANKGKKIYIHGINPYDSTGAMNTVLPNSGVVKVP